MTKIICSIAFILYANTIYAHNNTSSIIEALKKLETTTEGRLGIFAINTENGDKIEYRSNEIFPTGCTSKVIGVAAVLKKSISDPALLSQSIKYSKEELDAWSPVTEKYVSQGMTIKALCSASISFSDNTAMNFLLKPIGGIQGMTDFARSIGNTSFRQDNDWPSEAMSGGLNNIKDSSTPKAMVESLRILTMGTVLPRPQRDLLTTWLIETTTGGSRIRSGIPENWIVGNKTGTGGAYGSTNDIAIVWPEKHKPLLIGIYYTSNNKNAKNRFDVVSDATKLIVASFIKNDKKLKPE